MIIQVGPIIGFAVYALIMGFLSYAFRGEDCDESYPCILLTLIIVLLPTLL